MFTAFGGGFNPVFGKDTSHGVNGHEETYLSEHSAGRGKKDIIRAEGALRIAPVRNSVVTVVV